MHNTPAPEAEVATAHDSLPHEAPAARPEGAVAVRDHAGVGDLPHQRPSVEIEPLPHIAESIQLLDDYIRARRPVFFDQRLLDDAVLRRLEVIVQVPLWLIAADHVRLSPGRSGPG
jgi:hypothetical protein